jgi:hypothetical protein
MARDELIGLSKESGLAERLTGGLLHHFPPPLGSPAHDEHRRALSMN